MATGIKGEPLPGREGEVNQRELGGDLWCVVGVGQIGGDVHLEVLMVRNNRISQFQYCVALLFVRL